ncbi:hypothetical protein HA402_009296 [Bradysia odoriphaga]|nr:hypothetical protein HA402_009296 [Bradysia odoriphaga]
MGFEGQCSENKQIHWKSWYQRFRLGENFTVLQMFEEFFDVSFWETITTETNRYAQQVNDGKSSKKKKIDEKWVPVTVDEMKTYMALSIIMSQVKKQRVSMNWSTRSIIHTPIFARTMPYRRFWLITQFLHFSNNATLDKSHKMSKVREAVNFFNNKFDQMYTPEGDVSIDKSLMKFKGRLSNVVFSPQKRARYGIKYYKLCESNSGYCCGFKIYTGDDTSESNSDLGISGSIVQHLSSEILNKGYTLFIDNWSNRKNMPKDLPKLKLKKGESAARSSHGILAMKWVDRKDVYMLSTKHANVEMCDTGKTKIRKGGKCEVRNTFKPKCVIEYNRGMGGVDRQDQRLACFPVMRKFLKGYRKIFFYMVDMAIFNSFTFFCKVNSTKMQYVSYRLDVAEQLLTSVALPDYNTRGRPAQSDTPLRLQSKYWAHFPQHIPPTKKKQHPTRVCKVCFAHKKRSETTWECKKCLVALHVPDCFEAYHTLKNY